MANETRYRAYWPRGERAGAIRQPAPRLSTLNGKKVAFLWDDLFRGDEIFALLQEGINAKYPDVEFIMHDTFGSTHGSDEARILAELPEKLPALGVDAVVSGMGC